MLGEAQECEYKCDLKCSLLKVSMILPHMRDCPVFHCHITGHLI